MFVTYFNVDGTFGAVVNALTGLVGPLEWSEAPRHWAALGSRAGLSIIQPVEFLPVLINVASPESDTCTELSRATRRCLTAAGMTIDSETEEWSTHFSNEDFLATFPQLAD